MSNLSEKNNQDFNQNKWDQLIDEFLEYMEIERQASPLTIRNYRHYLYRFSAWLKQNFPQVRPGSLNLQIIKKYRVFLARYTALNGKNLLPITQTYHVIALRALLKWLIRHDCKTLGPEKIELPRVKSQSIKFLNTGQIERLMSQPLPSKKTGLRDRAILEMLFSTGLRVSELVKLDRERIDLKRREFGVTGKGGQSRVVFISSKAAKWLERYLASREDDDRALFIRYSGGKGSRRLTARSVQRLIRKYSKQAKLPVEVTPHVLRHSYATDLLMAGADLRSVQEMLGHKNVSTTQIYTHVTNKQLRDVHRAFHGKGGGS
jgi:site-specific recombinase XerD